MGTMERRFNSSVSAFLKRTGAMHVRNPRKVRRGHGPLAPRLGSLDRIPPNSSSTTGTGTLIAHPRQTGRW